MEQEKKDSMETSVLHLEKLEKSYGKHKVLTNVNLDVHKGDIFGLVGKNGSGKTTIFKVILGLSDYEKGTLSIKENGKEGRRIGFLIGTNFFPYMTGRQNLEYFRVMKGIKDKKEVDRVLKLVGMDQAKGKFKNYSLGMKQRLGIANAIMGSPEIVILDEPTNGLDPQGIADIRELVHKLNDEFGMTIIISSHILGELQHTAERFGMLKDGEILKTITREDLVTDHKSVRIQVDDLEKAKEALAAAGVQVISEQTESMSLEDYYFGLMGDNNENGEVSR